MTQAEDVTRFMDLETLIATAETAQQQATENLNNLARERNDLEVRLIGSRRSRGRTLRLRTNTPHTFLEITDDGVQALQTVAAGTRIR